MPFQQSADDEWDADVSSLEPSLTTDTVNLFQQLALMCSVVDSS